MTEWVFPLVLAAVIGWQLRAQPTTPAYIPPTTSAPSLLTMLEMDQPLSRAATIHRARETLDQYGADDEVALIVLAIEPDGFVHLHSVCDHDDIQRAIHQLKRVLIKRALS